MLFSSLKCLCFACADLAVEDVHIKHAVDSVGVRNKKRREMEYHFKEVCFETFELQYWKPLRPIEAVVEIGWTSLKQRHLSEFWETKYDNAVSKKNLWRAL